MKWATSSITIFSFYLLFVFTSLIALGGLIHLADAAFDREAVKKWVLDASPSLLQFVINLKYYVLLPILGIFAGYIFPLSSAICRAAANGKRIFSAAAPHGSPDTFISALEKVAIINGIPRDKPGWLWSWQHGTIGQACRVS